MSPSGGKATILPVLRSPSDDVSTAPVLPVPKSLGAGAGDEHLGVKNSFEGARPAFDELTYYEGLAIRLAKRRRLLNQGPALEGGKNTMLAVTVTVGIPILIIVVLVVIVLLLMRRRGR